MKRKVVRFFCYFFYSILVGLILFWGIRNQYLLDQQRSASFDARPFIVFSTLFPFVIGMLFALPSLYKKYRSSGKWKYDWIKFFSVGIPAAIAATIPLTYFSPISSIGPIGRFLAFLSNGGQLLFFISGMVFGFVTFCSFKKMARDELIETAEYLEG
ncbi:hypothetical protein ACOJQI_12640 [Bacillus salacetis]|uniref:hypothetical protein n=1 Tax=Bacillus salacetis TaxID=2315464 RepID=UPI003B9F2F64